MNYIYTKIVVLCISKRMILFLSIFFSQILYLFAQSINYSDPLFEKLLYNSSLSGISECPEFQLGYKKSYSYDFMTFSYNQYFEKYKTGGGLLFQNLSEANGVIHTISGGIIINHKIQISERKLVNTGFRVDYFQKSINASTLIFSQQIDPYTGAVTSNHNENFNVSYKMIDITGGISYFDKKIRAGIAFNHIDKLFNKKYGSILYPEIAFNFGKIFSVTKNARKTDSYLIPEILYQYRYGTHQIAYGLHLINNTFLTNIYLKQNILLQTLSGVFSFGINFKKFRISYAYELSISRYANIPTSSNQVMVRYQPECFKKRKNQNTIYCINF